MMQAMDWPPEVVNFEAFFLLVLGENPVGKHAWSPSDPIMTYLLQWVWLIKGTDLQAGLKGRNRGDRYRTSLNMSDELRQALYPQFCEKQYITQDANTGVITFNSYAPPDFIRWTPPEFRVRSDKDSGLLYGTASVTLTNILSEVTA